MDAERMFRRLKSTDDTSYRVSRGAAAAVRFAVFPLVICSVLAGGALTAYDGIVKDGGKAPEPVSAVKPVTAAKCVPSFSAEPEEDVFDYDADLLQRLYEFDRTSVPDGMVGIVPVSLYREPEPGKVWVSDAGDKHMADIGEYAENGLPVKYEEGDKVLIVHTHGTEAYSPEGALYCEPRSYPRSDDPSMNVIAIGDIFEKVLRDHGIDVIHCTVPIDKMSYSKAYENAADIIKEYTAKEPGIKYMFDIHRDAIELTDGSIARMVTSCGGRLTAQVMFVVGTDRLVSANKNWRGNMALAVMLQKELEEKYPGLMRPINMKKGAFNQHLVPVSVLIEVGCDGNSMEEAERAAYITAEQIAKTIKGE